MGFSDRWRVELGLSIEYSGVDWRNGVWLCGDATTRGIISCFGASLTLCRRSGAQSPGRLFLLTTDWFPPELVCVNHRVEDGEEFPHRSCEESQKGTLEESQKGIAKGDIGNRKRGHCALSDKHNVPFFVPAAITPIGPPAIRCGAAAF